MTLRPVTEDDLAMLERLTNDPDGAGEYGWHGWHDPHVWGHRWAENGLMGSAAGSLGAYLVKHGKLAAGHTLSILQGEAMGRPSHIEVEVTQRGKKLVPRVSGAAVKVFEGTITV